VPALFPGQLFSSLADTILFIFLFYFDWLSCFFLVRRSLLVCRVFLQAGNHNEVDNMGLSRQVGGIVFGLRYAMECEEKQGEL